MEIFEFAHYRNTGGGRRPESEQARRQKAHEVYATLMRTPTGRDADIVVFDRQKLAVRKWGERRDMEAPTETTGQSSLDATN